MKKTIQWVLVILTMAWSVTAFGHHMHSDTEASELDANLTRLPAHRMGLLSARACSDCDTETYRVNANTTYHVGYRTPAVSLDELRHATAMTKRNHKLRAGSESDIVMLVVYDLDTGEAVKVVLETGPVRGTS